MTELITCLWFNRNAEEAATFYASLLPDSRIDEVNKAPTDYPDGGKKGDVLQVEFSLLGKRFIGLNGGPQFPFTEAVSLQIICDDQAELDKYWAALSAHPENERCGWAKDKYGLSWQIIPKRLNELMADPDPARAQRAMRAMLAMKKIDIATLEAAAKGN